MNEEPLEVYEGSSSAEELRFYADRVERWIVIDEVEDLVETYTKRNGETP